MLLLPVYSVWRDSYYEVQWKGVPFEDFYEQREQGRPLETVLSLCVDGDTSAYRVSTPLEVWQSVDDALVLAVTTESVTEDRESSRLCRVAVAPSPVFIEEKCTAEVTSLTFQFSQNASQTFEKWQLLQLVNGPGSPKNVYHLLINSGAAVRVLALQAWRRQRRSAEDWQEGNKPRGLGISHFVENDWYYRPNFHIKMREKIEQRPSDSDGGVGVRRLCEHLFDVERFFGEFLDNFKPLRDFYLIDYDLQLVRSSVVEKAIFMVCVMALAPSDIELARTGRQLRVALFFSLELFTGGFHVIRALKVPGNEQLRQLSRRVAGRFLTDLNARIPPDPASSAWNNDALLREESLQELHNPVYPVSISGT